jgi:hypothetical protein
VHEFVEDLEATFEEYKQLAATRERRPAATPPQL